jgi:hypothetical protein
MGGGMGRVRAYLFTIIIAAIAVHFAWIAISPFIPYAMGGLVAIAILGFFYFRHGRW